MPKKKPAGGIARRHADPRKGGAGVNIARPKAPGKTGEYVERTVWGVPWGDVHKVAKLEDGTLEERTFCGSWPSAFPIRDDDLSRSPCPTCAKKTTMGRKRQPTTKGR